MAEMSLLQQTISRYLDGDLAPHELEQFSMLLASSPAARTLLREMETLRRAARNTPSLYKPSIKTETALFTQLRSEGLYTDHVQGKPHTVKVPRVSVSAAIGKAVVASCVVILAVLGFDISGNSPVATTPPPAFIAESITGAEPAPALQHHALHSNVIGTLATTTELPELDTPLRIRSVTSGITSILDSAVGDNSIMGHSYSKANDPEQATMLFTEPFNTPSGILAQMDLQSDDYSISETPVENTTDIANIPIPDDLALHQLSSESLYNQSHPSSPLFSASVRPGIAYINKGTGLVSDEVSIHIETNLGNAHRISFFVGKSPLVTEQNSTIIPSLTSVSGSNNGGSSPASIRPRLIDRSIVAEEVWAGIGYGYKVLTAGNAELEVGLKGGAGLRSVRIGAELPVRYRITDIISVQCVPTYTYTTPHDQGIRDFNNNYPMDQDLEVGIKKNPAFSTLSLEVGISVAVGG